MKKIVFVAFTSFIASFAIAQNNFTDLFDGKTLNGWKRVAGTGEYTIENNMIVGTKSGKTVNDVGEQIEAIKNFYGIGEQRLENLLRTG